jgi:hypothetical protein
VQGGRLCTPYPDCAGLALQSDAGFHRTLVVAWQEPELITKGTVHANVDWVGSKRPLERPQQVGPYVLDDLPLARVGAGVHVHPDELANHISAPRCGMTLGCVRLGRRLSLEVIASVAGLDLASFGVYRMLLLM